MNGYVNLSTLPDYTINMVLCLISKSSSAIESNIVWLGTTTLTSGMYMHELCIQCLQTGL